MSRRSCAKSFKAPQWRAGRQPSDYFAMTADALDGDGGDGPEALTEAWHRCLERLESAMLAWYAYAYLLQEGPTERSGLRRRLGVSEDDCDLAVKALEDMGMAATEGTVLRPLGAIAHRSRVA